MTTVITTVDSGHWESAEYSEEINIWDKTFLLSSWDHPSNGILYGVTYADDGKLIFLRYIYAKEISSVVENGTMSLQNDNGIVQTSLSVKNIDRDMFESEATLFQPGAKLLMRYRFGDSEFAQLGVTYIDDVDYDIRSMTVPLSGRNKIGFLLNTASLGFNTTFRGTISESIAAALELAGVKDYVIQQATDTKTFTFQPSTKILAAIQTMCDYYSNWSTWGLIELNSGRIVVGRRDWINSNYNVTGFYQFDGAHEVFKRKTSKNADAAYSSVYITGKDLNGYDLEPVSVSVLGYSHWKIPAQKIYFASAPDNMTQSELQSYAELLAAQLQYVGVSESFSSPFRPYLTVGDIAQIYYAGDEYATTIGTVTGLKHSFGQKGFSTEFTVESGGELMGDSSTVVLLTKALGGYTRQQNMLDFMRNIAHGY